MDVYHISFVVLVVLSGWLAWTQHRHELKSAPPKEADPIVVLVRDHEPHGDPNRLREIFIPVYLLVMGSDWLQGAYVYTLYKDEKGLAEPVVAALFTSGFLAAAISALFVGRLADRYGRRLACLVFCASYTVSCLTKISNDVIVLFIGRLLGGLSTTLMYSVFESWMVTEYYAQRLERSGMSLSAMFGIMTTLNSVVAIISGVVGESLVAATGTKVSPFMAAIVCLGLAFWLMLRNWTENYGDIADLKKVEIPSTSTRKILFQDKRILLLGFISCCFEGSMYIFVFYWSAAMESAHNLSATIRKSSLQSVIARTAPGAAESETHIPFGVIFATFMAAMMLGSLLFSKLSTRYSHSHSLSPAPPTATTATTALIATSRANTLRRRLNALHAPPSALLTLAMLLSSTSLVVPVLLKSEAATFWAFCLFEACIGIYYPSMAAQKGRIVADGVRASVYGLLRIPLNVFVVVALTTTVEGDAHRDAVFVFCAGLLLAASVAAGWWLDDGPGGGAVGGDGGVETDDDEGGRERAG